MLVAKKRFFQTAMLEFFNVRVVASTAGCTIQRVLMETHYLACLWHMLQTEHGGLSELPQGSPPAHLAMPGQT
jgi:hypothetical protein